MFFFVLLMKVVYNKLDGSVVCCCQLFVRCGILCRHIFCVFKNCNVVKDPDQYILKRWTRDLIPPDLRRQKARYGQENEEIEKLAIEASSLVESCVSMMIENQPKLTSFVGKLRKLKSEVESDMPKVPSRTVSQMVHQFLGVQKPKKKVVKNPSKASNKGYMKDRIKGGREIALEESKKQKKGCGICGSKDHNRRTCPQRSGAAGSGLDDAGGSGGDGAGRSGVNGAS